MNPCYTPARLVSAKFPAVIPRSELRFSWLYPLSDSHATHLVSRNPSAGSVNRRSDDLVVIGRGITSSYCHHLRLSAAGQIRKCHVQADSTSRKTFDSRSQEESAYAGYHLAYEVKKLMYASVVNALPRTCVCVYACACVRVCVCVCACARARVYMRVYYACATTRLLFARLLYSEHYPLHIKTILDPQLRDRTFPVLIPEINAFSFSKYKCQEHRCLINCHSSVNSRLI